MADFFTLLLSHTFLEEKICHKPSFCDIELALLETRLQTANQETTNNVYVQVVEVQAINSTEQTFRPTQLIFVQ